MRNPKINGNITPGSEKLHENLIFCLVVWWEIDENLRFGQGFGAQVSTIQHFLVEKLGFAAPATLPRQERGEVGLRIFMLGSYICKGFHLIGMYLHTICKDFHIICM